MIPRPIGMSSRGSKSFFIARYMSIIPTIIIMMLPAVALANPVYVRNSLKFSMINLVKSITACVYLTDLCFVIRQ